MSAQGELQGRNNEYRLLCEDLEAFGKIKAAKASFGIIGISGYGGVGKTYLFENVLRESRPHLNDALFIRLDGSNANLLADFAAMIDYRLAPRNLPAPANPKFDYFHQTRRLVHALYSLRRDVESELDREEKLAENIRNIAKAIYKARPLLAKIPDIGPWVSSILQSLEAAQAHEHVPAALEALSELRALKSSRGFFGRKHARQMVAHDPYNSVADAYRGDVENAIVKYRKKDRMYALPGKLKGVNRFLLVVDDFETVGEAIGDFLVESLLRRLQDAPFPVLTVFLGRDDVYEEHTDFHQHFSKAIIRRIPLKPFSFDDAIRYLESAGYDRAEAESIYTKSGGYPFVLSLFAEHRSQKEQQTAIFYQRFFERTTHWMTENEKEWILKLSYLDVVNIGTIEAMLPGVDANVVAEWFRNEASVRDTAARHYVVQPFIKEMLLTYHKNLIGSKQQSALEARAKEAMANA
jgi:hypothetical protein